jgi:hypothetical protein
MSKDSSPKPDSATRSDRSNGLRKADPPALGGITTVVPALFANAGEHAAFSVIEFFTAQIRNPNTLAAYGAAVRDFADWCERRGLRLEQLRSPHVGLYIRRVHRPVQRADGEAAPRRDPHALRLAHPAPGG